MPLNGFRSVTVSPETYDKACKLVHSGIEKNIGQAFANAMFEYFQAKEPMLKDIDEVFKKYNQVGEAKK